MKNHSSGLWRTLLLLTVPLLVCFVVFCLFHRSTPLLHKATTTRSVTPPTVTAPPTAYLPNAPAVDDTTVDGSIGNYISTSPAQNTETTLPMTGAITVPAAENYTRPIGRTVFQNNVRWFSYSGCGIEFKCSAAAADIVCTVPDSSSVVRHHRPRVGVFVNGILTNDVVLDETSTTIRVNLRSDGESTVKLLKLSESMHSCVGVSSITLYGASDIRPTEEKMNIEFIGDSITAGFGLDEPNSAGSFSTRTENFCETYAYLASTALGADGWGIAYSGYGVLSGYTTSGAQNTAATLPLNYEKALTNCRSINDYAATWYFTTQRPQYIVINLGTNDASYCRSTERREQFAQAYQSFLGQVRTRNPGAYILCVLGDMNNALYPYIQQAVASYRSITGDQGVDCMTLAFQMDNYPHAISGHPSRESNFVAAQALTNRLWQQMGQ